MCILCLVAVIVITSFVFFFFSPPLPILSYSLSRKKNKVHMSLYGLSGTLVWQSEGGSNSDAATSHPHEPSQSAKHDGSVIRSDNEVKADASSTLFSHLESMGTTDDDIGLYSAENESAASAVPNRYIAKTSVLYEFATSPEQAYMDVYEAWSEKPFLAVAAAVDIDSNKSHCGDNTTYHGIDRAPSDVSSVPFLLENVSNEPVVPSTRSPAAMKTCQGGAPLRTENSLDHLHSSASPTAPLEESASVARRWRVEPALQPITTAVQRAPETPAVVYSSLDSPEYDWLEYYDYGLQPLFDSAEPPKEKEECVGVPPCVAARRPIPPVRPATDLSPRPSLFTEGDSNRRAAATPMQQQSRQPQPAFAVQMTPLSLVHGRHKPKSPVQRCDRLHGEEEVVPTVMASNRLLRLLRPLHLAVPRCTRAPSSSVVKQGQKAMQVNVSTLRSTVLASSSHVYRSLSRRSSFSGDASAPLASSLSSVRVVRPRVSRAVFESNFRVARQAAVEENGKKKEDNGVDRRPGLTLNVATPLSRQASSRAASVDSSATICTVVIANPIESKAESERASQQLLNCVQFLPSSVQCMEPPTPSAPPREATSESQRILRRPFAASVQQEDEGDSRINQRGLTRETGCEDNAMIAPSSPSGRRVTAVRTDAVTAAATPDNTCVYVRPRAPPPALLLSSSSSSSALRLRAGAAAGAAPTLTADVATDATPFRIALVQASPCAAHPNLKRYPSRMTPVSLPKANAPDMTNTAPMASKKFVHKSKLSTACDRLTQSTTSTEAKTSSVAELGPAPNTIGAVVTTTPGATPPPAAAVRATVATTAPRKRAPPSKLKRALPFAVPATAGITLPATLFPSLHATTTKTITTTTTPVINTTTTVLESSENSIPLVREHRPEEQERVKTKIVPAPCSNSVLQQPFTATQLALPPNDDDDTAVLQTARRDSPYEPSQASPEWQDVPVPELRRGLFARFPSQDVRGERGSSSPSPLAALTTHPRHG